MPRPVVTVEGARELRKALKAVEGGLEDLKDTHAKIAAVVVPVGRSGAPRRTGRLAGSVRGSGTKTMAVVRAGGARVVYGGPIHFLAGRPGTSARSHSSLTRHSPQSRLGSGSIPRTLRHLSIRRSHHMPRRRSDAVVSCRAWLAAASAPVLAGGAVFATGVIHQTSVGNIAYADTANARTHV